MEMRKCLNGHYYDASIHSECPYCTGTNENGVTVPLNMANDDNNKTMPLGYVAPAPAAPASDRTMPLSSAVADNDDGRTVALIKHDIGIDPVVGWLVCIDGKEKGRDYRIHSDNNFIGRSDRMDICLRGDETVSRENHAIISYDSVEGTFFFSPGDGRSIVRLNDKALFQTNEIKAYDKIVIGKTTLLFVPLCGNGFNWEGSVDGE